MTIDATSALPPILSRQFQSALRESLKMPLPSKMLVVFQGAFPENDLLNAGATRVADLARGIQHAGMQTLLVAPNHFQSDSQTPNLQNCDISFRHIGTLRSKPSISSRNAFWKEVVRLAITEQYDCVLFYNTTIDSLTAMRKLRRSNKTVLYELCDLFSLIRPKWTQRLFHNVTERLCPRSSDLIVTISTGIQDHLRSTAPNVPSILIPGLYDTEKVKIDKTAGLNLRRQLNIGDTDPIIAYVGSWQKIKGLRTLIDAWKHTVDEFPQAKLLITGTFDGNESSFDVKEYSSTLAPCCRPSFPGYLSESSIQALLSTSDILVCPHDDHQFARYAFPTKVAEYAGMGRAIISTDIGDVKLYLPHLQSSWICPPRDSNSMAAGMRMLLSSSELREQLGQAAANAARVHFDYRNNGQRLVSEISKLQKTAR